MRNFVKRVKRVCAFYFSSFFLLSLIRSLVRLRAKYARYRIPYKWIKALKCNVARKFDRKRERGYQRRASCYTQTKYLLDPTLALTRARTSFSRASSPARCTCFASPNNFLPGPTSVLRRRANNSCRSIPVTSMQSLFVIEKPRRAPDLAPGFNGRSVLIIPMCTNC